MTMRLIEITDRVSQELKQRAWPALVWGFGQKAIAALDAREPYLAWAPSEAGDRFGPPDAAGEIEGGDARPYATITTRLEAHCRGGDFEITEALRHDLAAILHEMLQGSAELVGGGWLRAGDSYTSRTEVYILLVDVRQPITDRLHGQPAAATGTVETVSLGSELEIGGVITPDVPAP